MAGVDRGDEHSNWDIALHVHGLMRTVTCTLGLDDPKSLPKEWDLAAPQKNNEMDSLFI